MLFMVSYAFSPDSRDVVQARFKETGGMPGPGVTMLGRWHALGENRGFVLSDSSDSVALGKWLQEWSDVLEFEVTPVNDDEQVMKVLGG